MLVPSPSMPPSPSLFLWVPWPQVSLSHPTHRPQCSKSCSSGTRRRQVICALGPPSHCRNLQHSKPRDMELCNTQPCHLPQGEDGLGAPCFPLLPLPANLAGTSCLRPLPRRCLASDPSSPTSLSGESASCLHPLEPALLSSTRKQRLPPHSCAQHVSFLCR